MVGFKYFFGSYKAKAEILSLFSQQKSLLNISSGGSTLSAAFLFLFFLAGERAVHTTSTNC